MAKQTLEEMLEELYATPTPATTFLEVMFSGMTPAELDEIRKDPRYSSMDYEIPSKPNASKC